MSNFTYSMISLGVYGILVILFGGSEFTPGIIMGWIGQGK